MIIGKFYAQAVIVANQCAYRILRRRDTCILTSYALAFALNEFGFCAKPTRVTVKVFPKKRGGCGVVLGGDGCGQRREKVHKGMWNGHCAVLTRDGWLLDPTLDQASQHGMCVKPLAVKLKDLSANGASTRVDCGKHEVSIHVYHHQKSVASAPDARRSHWHDVGVAILERLNKERACA